ncbi:MAG: RNA methyltransferase [Cystobacterineae bacterium]|nr:RNA methyltransferase [Cystobacterineae bacterium]
MWPPLLICHELQCAENLGAIARLLGNFGFSGCRLSRPWVKDWESACRVAVDAAHLLEEFVVMPSLEEALEDVVYAVGTSFRACALRRHSITPEEGIKRLWEKSTQGKIALVLGGERRGLSDEELALCHEVVCIPTPGTKPSLNLAQAAAICLFLCAQQGKAPQEAPIEPRAPLGFLERLKQKMRHALLSAGFLNPQAPHYVFEELWQSLARANLSQREAELWLNAFKHVERHRLHVPPSTPSIK